MTENKPDSGRVMFFLLITFDEEDDSDALFELRGIFSISSSNGEGVLPGVVDCFDLLRLLKTTSTVSDKEFNMRPLSSSE